MQNNIKVGTIFILPKTYEPTIALVVQTYLVDGNHNQPRCVYIDNRGNIYNYSCNTVHEYISAIAGEIILEYRYTTQSQLKKDFLSGRFSLAFENAETIL